MERENVMLCDRECRKVNLISKSVYVHSVRCLLKNCGFCGSLLKMY